jgi:phosphoenolpyruvate-protein kinase (PTS system EI component)
LSRSASSALTIDGVEVLVGANVGSIEEARIAGANGSDLCGLVRTEFLYLERRVAPSVEEQVEIYRALAQALGGRRMTLRTLDVGGDKPLAYAPQSPEANPFLGVRGIRLALEQRQLLDDQLQAVVRVAHETPISLMFPMVSTVDELLEAQSRLEAVIATDGRGWPDDLQVGVMIEVPAAALKARAFADHVDFFSIGTNDLTQYALAAERGNPEVAAIADPLDPGVLHLIDSVCRAADGRRLVAVCGELAADEKAVPLLVGLGVRELSVAPAEVPSIKEVVRRVERAADHDLVRSCLDAAGPAQVRELLGARSGA